MYKAVRATTRTMMAAPIPPPIIAPVFFERPFEVPTPVMPSVGTGTLVEKTCVLRIVTGEVNTRFPEVKVVSEVVTMVVVTGISVNDVPSPAPGPAMALTPCVGNDVA